jgi:hypothetical protein
MARYCPRIYVSSKIRLVLRDQLPDFLSATPSPNQTPPLNIGRQNIDHAVVAIHAMRRALGSDRTEEHCSDMEAVVRTGLAGLHLRL